MPLLKRLATLLALALLAGLVGCSSLTLAYGQLPLIGSLWVDRYLDLDSAQRARVKEQLRQWQSWHRREELPQWQALIQQANTALDDGVTTEELLTLERSVRASLERCLQHAAPLAAPVLAGLQPAQWTHLKQHMEEKAAEWREKQTAPGGPDERAKRYVETLERWLGDLSRPTRRQARADAHAWRVDVAALAQARAARQADTLAALQAWAHNDLAGGNALLARDLLPQPAELAYREMVTASVLRLLNSLSPAERERVRKHWAGWSAQLQVMQAG